MKCRPTADLHLTQAVSDDEMKATISTLKPQKAAGLDNIHPEFLLKSGPGLCEWLQGFLSPCIINQIPKSWRHAQVIAILKPGNSADNHVIYRPILFLSFHVRTLGELILNRITDIVDQQLPREQAGFMRNKCITDQLTQDTEDSFLTAAYDTVWQKGLENELPQMTPDGCINLISSRTLSRL